MEERKKLFVTCQEDSGVEIYSNFMEYKHL